jgi:signal transduction histidine kinase
MQTLSRRLVEVQENERRTVARELHDEAAQALVSLRYGLQLLERETGGEGVAARVAELKQTTDAVIESLHRLAGALRPASLDLVGLEAALRQHLHTIESKWPLTVRFKARGLNGARLPAAVETALYRVVQEAVTNVVRHAAATRIDVLVERRDGRVVVVVEDDGNGFVPATAGGTERLGLIGMRERAEALGGTLTIESAPGEGTTIAVEVACDDPHPDC